MKNPKSKFKLSRLNNKSSQDVMDEDGQHTPVRNCKGSKARKRRMVAPSGMSLGIGVVHNYNIDVRINVAPSMGFLPSAANQLNNSSSPP